MHTECLPSACLSAIPYVVVVPKRSLLSHLINENQFNSEYRFLRPYMTSNTLVIVQCWPKLFTYCERPKTHALLNIIAHVNHKECRSVNRREKLSEFKIRRCFLQRGCLKLSRHLTPHPNCKSHLEKRNKNSILLILTQNQYEC